MIDRGSSARALRALLLGGGVVATAAGMHTVVVGGKSLPGRRLANPVLESELRFYATYYVAFGLAALRVAPRADRDANAVRALAGTLFLSGLARAGGWLAAGRPHRLQRTLLAIELALPPTMIALSARASAR